MSIRASELDHAWHKVGLQTRQGRRHIIAQLRLGGKLYLTTMRSRGSGALRGQLPDLIRQQMRLDKQQFADLLNCPLKRDGFLQILADRGVVPPDVLENSLS